jgi:hypothetical protein
MTTKNTQSDLTGTKHTKAYLVVDDEDYGRSIHLNRINAEHVIHLQDIQGRKWKIIEGEFHYA